MSAVALQDAIVAALLADAAVSGLVGAKVYDNAPAGVDEPYITLGPSQVLDDDAGCIAAEEHHQQIDVWTKESAAKRGCKAICSAVKKALHGAELTMDEGAAVLIEVTDWTAQDDPAEFVAHGIVNVRALVDEV